MEGLEAWGRRSRALGFVGMGCIHPLQIEVIHRAFAPGEIEIARAASIVAAFEEAKARGLSVVSLGSKMVDPPVVLRALKLVEQAKAMGIPVPSTQPLA
jgi:citrate lyase subunit beta / citryl-CoA lyase